MVNLVTPILPRYRQLCSQAVEKVAPVAGLMRKEVVGGEQHTINTNTATPTVAMQQVNLMHTLHNLML